MLSRWDCLAKTVNCLPLRDWLYEVRYPSWAGYLTWVRSQQNSVFHILKTNCSLWEWIHSTQVRSRFNAGKISTRRDDFSPFKQFWPSCQMYLCISPKLWLFFLLSSVKYTKKSSFCHFNDKTTRQMTTFFFTHSLSSIGYYISFLHFKTFKIQFHGLPPSHYAQVRKIHIYMPKMTILRL